MSTVAQPVNSQESVVDKNEVVRFVVDCMLRVGTEIGHADQLGQLLLAADYRGHYSHGLNRLEMYVDDIRSKTCCKSGEPKILKEKVSTAWVDGCNLLGPVVGNFCMQLAIAKAKESGVGWVVAKGSNHFGIAGWYSMLALQHGLIGVSMTNSSPLMVPTRAKKPAIGTNPISVAASAENDDRFVLDMATTAVALGKVEIAARKGESIPKGWAVDCEGRESTDPAAVNSDGGLLPLGGTESTSGYKGYGLGTMVELFCGVLSGGAFGTNVRRWKDKESIANLGQCFVAVDSEAFAPEFHSRLQMLLNQLRSSELAEEETKSVLVSGDPEQKHMDLCDSLGGIPYHQSQLQHANQLAIELDVRPMILK